MFDTNRLRGPFYGLPDAGFASTLDCASLTATREAIAIHMKVIDRKFYAIHALSNWSAPINRLPDETLVEIFTLANPKPQRVSALQFPPTRATDPPLIGSHCWASLMLVCRHWNALIVGNARLWHAIDVTMRSAYHLLFACRYGSRYGAALELAFQVPKAVRILPEFDFLPPLVSKLLLPRMECKFLRHAFVALDQPWPKLEELTVLSKCRLPALHSPTPNIDLSMERFPMLSVLCLSGIAVSWDAGLLSRLSRLELVDCAHVGSPLTLDGFLDVLELCPGLQELRLHNFLSSVPPRRPRRRGRTVSLPVLKDFGLYDELAHVTELINTIHLPEDVRLHVGATIENPDPNDLEGPDRSAYDLKRLLPKNRHQFSIIRCAQTAKIEVRTGMMKLVVTDGDTYLILEIRVKDLPEDAHFMWSAVVPDAIAAVCDMLELTMLRELEIVGNRDYVYLHDHLNYLERFTELEVLRLEGHDEHLEGGAEIANVSEGLTRMMDYDEEEECFFCPELRKLSFARVEWVDSSMDAIRKCLSLRAEHGLFLEELHLELDYPGVTSEDEFQVFKAPFYEELCALVPGGKVTMKRVT
ncbi:hypothetical protein OH77DRAFT_505826 [Trametes cingulata]|nr:hypothetical protein OH77DRAFT_505826 [Trametes cingulata]